MQICVTFLESATTVEILITTHIKLKRFHSSFQEHPFEKFFIFDFGQQVRLRLTSESHILRYKMKVIQAICTFFSYSKAAFYKPVILSFLYCKILNFVWTRYHWCNEEDLKYSTLYPGQSFKIPIVLYGQRNGSVPGTVHVELVNKSRGAHFSLRYKKLKTLSIHVQT